MPRQRSHARPLTRDRLEQACRLSKSVHQAATMLDCKVSSFRRACEREGLTLPFLGQQDISRPGSGGRHRGTA